VRPGKHQRSKQRCQDYVGRSTTAHNLLFCVHTLYTNYVTKRFYWLVPQYGVKNSRLCLLHGQGQKREQKHTTKNFVGFHNQSPLLTMIKGCLVSFVYISAKTSTAKPNKCDASVTLDHLDRIHFHFH